MQFFPPQGANKMRRASKILTLILVVVFLFGIFAGCDLVGKDTKKYREAVAVKVGGQQITIGKLLDTFNSYYNNYYYYVSAGILDLEGLLDMAMHSLYTQYMKVDAYVTNTASKTYTLKNAEGYDNAKFLTQEQFDYSVSYVKYIIFTSFDSNVMEKVEAKYELNDEEAEDKSRDFYEYDDLGDVNNYAEYYLHNAFFGEQEDLDEYIADYFGEDGAAKFADPKANIKDLYLSSAQKKIDELNERIDEDNDKIALGDYQDYQTAVYKQYENALKKSYGLTIDEFMKLQTNDLIMSGIVALYNYELYKDIENDDMMSRLTANYETLKAAQKSEFEISKNYENFVEGLSASSFIYNVPADYAKSYVFVKNILIPFSAAQTAKLNSLKATLGTTDSERYTGYRNTLAASIVADDFTSEKNEDGEYEKLEKNPFIFDNGEVKINPECTELSAYLSDGNVTAMEDKTADDTIKELMKRYNTDTAQHSALYSYVVRVGAPDTYTHQWVQEFVDATEAAMNNGGAGHYGIGVSDYGVHIVYVEGYVTAVELNFTKENYLNTTTNEYRLFKTYFEERVNALLTEDLETLRDSYKGKIEGTAVFNRFLKENKMEYDLVERFNSED